MEHHPVEFLNEGGVVKPGVFLNTVNTDIDVGMYRHSKCCVLEGDNVGVSVVIEEVFIDPEEILIGTEDIIDSLHLEALVPEQA